MKLTIFFLLFTINIFAQKRDSVFVKTKDYDVMYSEKLEQPIWVKYIVKCPHGNYPRKNMNFYINDSIHTSDDLDYKNNIYDKGHLAPAADFNCDSQTLIITFSYLNCSLQNQNLNRGAWKSLEFYERDLAAKYTLINIEVYCVFSDKSKKLLTGATVPDGFYKIIYYNNKKFKFYFPNTDSKEKDFMKYLVK